MNIFNQIILEEIPVKDEVKEFITNSQVGMKFYKVTFLGYNNLKSQIAEIINGEKYEPYWKKLIAHTVYNTIDFVNALRQTSIDKETGDFDAVILNSEGGAKNLLFEDFIDNVANSIANDDRDLLINLSYQIREKKTKKYSKNNTSNQNEHEPQL